MRNEMNRRFGQVFQASLVALVLATAGLAQTDPPVSAEDTGGNQAVAAPPVPRDPSKGQVTSLPLPRFVTLKTDEGNARRGPGLSHRIDWVFRRAGMPLKITAEYENWRRVEDQEGLGGWVHYSLLSGVRSALIIAEMADLRSGPDSNAEVIARAERGVIGRIQECTPDWCRFVSGGERGWVSKAALWGVEPGEILE
jgi:SH3-like domain-containing protein